MPSPASSNQCPSSTTTDIETLIPTEIESDDEQVPTVIASDDEQAPSDTEAEEERVVELVAASIRRVTALEKQCAETSLQVQGALKQVEAQGRGFTHGSVS